METDPLTSTVIDEDIQIVRSTLAAITPDVRRLSWTAAEAVQQALEKLEFARRELAHCN
jgi:hypothetical protein